MMPMKLIVVADRSGRLMVENHRRGSKELMSKHEYAGVAVRKTIGNAGTAFVVTGVGSGVVVVQVAEVRGLE